MQKIEVLLKADADGVLTVRLPLGVPNAEYDVVVLLQPKNPSPMRTPEELGWPPDFEKTAGSITDETFTRQPQGEYEKREAFD